MAPPQTGDTLDVRDLFFALARGWWLIALFAAIGLYQGYQSLVGFSPEYEATLIVAPTSGASTQASGGALAQVSRSLGIQVSAQSEASTFDRVRLLIGSPQFVAYLDERHSIMLRLLRNAWDEATGEWIKPSGRRFKFEQRIRAAVHLPTWRAPSLESVADHLRSAIVFTRKEDQPAFITVSYKHADAAMARWVLETVFYEGDNYLRSEDRRKTEKRVEYLRQQIGVQNLDFRAMFLSMLAEQERNLMLLSADNLYAAEVSRPIHVSPTPSAPDLVRDFGVIVVGWTLAGALLVLFISLIRRPRT
jgi:LPS O-antigen subunit length determinant protein (WzzB/FepE family)